MIRRTIATLGTLAALPAFLPGPAAAADAPSSAVQRDPDQAQVVEGPAYPRQARNTNITRVKYSADPDTGVLTVRVRIEKFQADTPNYAEYTRVKTREPRTGKVRFGCPDTTVTKKFRDNVLVYRLPASCFRTSPIELQVVRKTSFEATDYRDSTRWLLIDVRP